jgi:hypothetical protein
MRCGQCLLPLLAGLALMLLPPAAQATTILPANFTDMVSGSAAIVHGTIVDVRAQTTGGRRAIESIVTVAVIEAIKGPAAVRVVFRVPNGQVGRYRRVTVGAPEFTAGDEVVLFLDGRPPVVPMPYGLNQGVYRVTRASGQPAVMPFADPAAGRIVRGDPARRPVTVAAFARHIRTLLEPR